jgi:glycosyltransferase involved in cell wall biosynthesis
MDKERTPKKLSFVIFTDLTTYGVDTWNRTLVEALEQQSINANIVTSVNDIMYYRPDLIIFSDSSITSNFKIKEFVYKCELPYVVVTHLITAEDLISAVGIYKNKIMETLEKAVKIIAVSKSISLKLAPFTDKPIEVIYPGLPYFLHIGERNTYRNLFLIPSYGKLYLTVARLSKVKGYYRLLDAIEYMREKAPTKFADATFVWVGGGPNELNLHEEIHKRRLEQKIILTGQQCEVNVASWLAAADYFVLPSYAEGLPIALIEAVAIGLPIIVTPVDGIKELFGHLAIEPEELGNTLCNPPGNSDAAQQVYIDHLTHENTVCKVIACLQNALNKKLDNTAKSGYTDNQGEL